ncbi:MAG: TolC family protein [Gammaproteobacteria bacterium]|nr:TolC family protein [Gammaproteobacteria bacterium]
MPYEFFLDAKNSQRQSKIRVQEVQLAKLKTRQFMNILRGRFPADELWVSDDKLFPSLDSFIAEIPATTLVNRPDIQAAFSELQAFNRLERSANKALLPQLNLSASLSKSGRTLKKALGGDLLWQLVGGLTQPLFNGGQLSAIARQKSAEAVAVWWQYQNRVLKAMLEVENALANDKLLRWQLEQKEAEVNNLEKKIGSAKERFSDGDLSLSDYLLIKIEQIEVQMALIDVEVLYFKNRIDLITALGLPIEPIQQSDNGGNSDEKP